MAACTCWPLQCLIVASKEDKETQDKLIMTNTRLLGLCASHDSIVRDQDKMAQAAETYRWGHLHLVMPYAVATILVALTGPSEAPLSGSRCFLSVELSKNPLFGAQGHSGTLAMTDCLGRV